MADRTSFSTTDERLNLIDAFIDKHKYPDRSTVINTAIDELLKKYKSIIYVDFLYWICIPLFMVLVCIGLTLYTASIFFYSILVIAAIYLIVFIFLFYDKYKGVKYGTPNK